jgi:hypothetical protein
MEKSILALAASEQPPARKPKCAALPVIDPAGRRFETVRGAARAHGLSHTAVWYAARLQCYGWRLADAAPDDRDAT